MKWTPEQLSDLSGNTYVITGGNSGLGLEAAKLLTGKGARVVITTRSEDKASAAIDEIREAVPDAEVDFVLLDLTDPDSIATASAAVRESCQRIDALVNNAGVMQTPERRTDEGFELQLATNHLGHFRLNAALLDVLEASEGRIVPVSSGAHHFGRIDLDDLNAEASYDPTAAYGQSKLANLMYAFELQRRLSERGSSVRVVPCHPGYADTNLQSAGVGMEGGSSFFRGLYKLSNKLIAQPADQGAWPLVFAAAAPQAEGGTYYGPAGLMEARGAVGEARVASHAKDEEVARKLWEKTEEMTGCTFFG